MATVAGVGGEVFEPEEGAVVGWGVEKEGEAVEVGAFAIKGAHYLGVLLLHAIHLVLHGEDAVLCLRYLVVEDAHLCVDVVDEACALLNLFVEGVELGGGEFGVLLGLGKFVVEALDFGFGFGFFLFELRFGLPVDGLGKENEHCKEQE